MDDDIQIWGDAEKFIMQAQHRVWWDNVVKVCPPDGKLSAVDYFKLQVLRAFMPQLFKFVEGDQYVDWQDVKKNSAFPPKQVVRFTQELEADLRSEAETGDDDHGRETDRGLMKQMQPPAGDEVLGELFEYYQNMGAMYKRESSEDSGTASAQPTPVKAPPAPAASASQAQAADTRSYLERECSPSISMLIKVFSGQMLCFLVSCVCLAEAAEGTPIDSAEVLQQLEEDRVQDAIELAKFYNTAEGRKFRLKARSGEMGQVEVVPLMEKDGGLFCECLLLSKRLFKCDCTIFIPAFTKLIYSTVDDKAPQVFPPVPLYNLEDMYGDTSLFDQIPPTCYKNQKWWEDRNIKTTWDITRVTIFIQKMCTWTKNYFRQNIYYYCPLFFQAYSKTEKYSYDDQWTMSESGVFDRTQNGYR